MFSFRKKKENTGVNLASSLRDERAKSEIILNSIEDGVILLDTNHQIQLFNRGAELITGWVQKDAIGLDYKSVIRLVNDKGELYDEMQDPLNKSLSLVASVRDNNANLKTLNDKTVAISISVNPLTDDKNAITGAVAIFRDVTSERQEERQRAEFISTASHEMRTPVAAIEGYLALAMNERVARIDAKAREYLEKAHSSTQHLGKLFQDLLTSAKAEDGRLQNHPVVVEMGEMLQQLTEDVRFTAEKKGLGVDFVIGATPADGSNTQKLIKPLYYTYIDPERIREVIVNIFDNAIKYTETGKITIGLAGDENVVQIRVQDTGNGIPAEDIPHLFEKFYRVDNTATRTIGGTGLGLFICRKIVELYNGRIWVASELNNGSTFFINIPRITAAKAQELQTKEAAQNLQSNTLNQVGSLKP